MHIGSNGVRNHSNWTNAGLPAVTQKWPVARPRSTTKRSSFATATAIVRVYKDHGISGAKARDKRPEFDRLLP
jgi:hypothetical protein